MSEFIRLTDAETEGPIIFARQEVVLLSAKWNRGSTTEGKRYCAVNYRYACTDYVSFVAVRESPEAVVKLWAGVKQKTFH